MCASLPQWDQLKRRNKVNKCATCKFQLLHISKNISTFYNHKSARNLKIWSNWLLKMQWATLPMTRTVTLTSFKSWLFAAIQKYCPASSIFTSLMWRLPFASCLNLFLSILPRSFPQLMSGAGVPVALHRNTVDLPRATVVFFGFVINLTAKKRRKTKDQWKMFNFFTMGLPLTTLLYFSLHTIWGGELTATSEY